MRLTWRDSLATVFVLVGALLYSLWLAGIEVLGLGPRGVGVVVMGLGLAASVTAVVYGIGAGLMQAPRTYLAIASLIGLVALVSGVITLLTASEAMLGLLVAATVALWLMATIRHSTMTETPAEDQPVGVSFRNAA
jgi:hypothetical protein